MKTSVIVLLLLGLCFTAHSRLPLSAGETWSYSFSSLPQTGSVSSFGNNPKGTLQFTLDGVSLGAGDRLQYDMYEGAPSGTSIASGIWQFGGGASTTLESLGAWQDLEGSIKFTMLAGQVNVDSVAIEAIVSGPSLSSLEVHSVTFEPVPEPGTWALLGIAAGLFVCKAARRRS